MKKCSPNNKCVKKHSNKNKLKFLYYIIVNNCI